MEKPARASDDFDYIQYPAGENAGTDMRRPFARYANKLLKKLGREGSNTSIDLGDETGEVSITHVRFRDAAKDGNLKAYVRQEASDPKVVVTTVVAIGIVAAGLYKLKNSKK